MDRPATPFVVNSKITFCEAPGDDAPRYTGLVKKTKESLVALIVSNKDKGALFPDIGALIYFPYEREGAPWQATATVAQNSSWPLLILELEDDAPVGAAMESPLDLDDEVAEPASHGFRRDGSHLGDVEDADDGLISLPEHDDERGTPPVPGHAAHDELTDDELAAAEAGAAEALGDEEDPLAGLPAMPDPLRDLPEIDDADLAADLEADLTEAMAQAGPSDFDEAGFDDDLSEMEMVESQELAMDEPMEDSRLEGEEEPGAEEPHRLADDAAEEEEGPLLAWSKTTPLAAVSPSDDVDDLILDETVGEETGAPSGDSDETATLPPGTLPAPADDREFFPVTVHAGELPSPPAGLDPAVAGIIDQLQRRLARLEENLGNAVSPAPLCPNGFCLALGGGRMVVALPSGCLLAAGDEVTVAVDHQWRDRLSFRLPAMVTALREEEGVAVVTLRLGPVDREAARAIDDYREGIGEWRALLSGLAVG